MAVQSVSSELISTCSSDDIDPDEVKELVEKSIHDMSLKCRIVVGNS